MNSRNRRACSFPDGLIEPVEVDPGLRWRGPVQPESTTTTEKPIPSRQRDPWSKGHLIGQKRPLKRVGGFGEK
jgi:hypothetical protein